MKYESNQSFKFRRLNRSGHGKIHSSINKSRDHERKIIESIQSITIDEYSNKFPIQEIIDI